MAWNWQHKDWPRFIYDDAALGQLSARFETEAAKLIGASAVVAEDQRRAFTIELMSEEALKSSKIEGETLNRDSVASSLLRQFGFEPPYSDHRASAKERGIAALMVDNYRTYEAPLTHEMLFNWHRCIIGDDHRLQDVGRYRTSETPMQVVSGRVDKPRVHFEAPPAAAVPREMAAFLEWFNDTAPGGRALLPALARAGIAHLYFVSIHPFEDGNGRIGRAISEKALAQGQGRPALFALSHSIEAGRPEYYKQLETASRNGMAVDGWLRYFGETAIEAVKHSQRLVLFIAEKTRLFDRVRPHLNERQEAVLARMFAEGPEGFKGGMTADKYVRITGAISRTATRDLQDLVTAGALTKTGRLKGTRYWLNLGPAFEGEKRRHLAEQEARHKKG